MKTPPALIKKIRAIPYLSALKKVAKKKNVKVYLVGGFLRDYFLKEHKDSRDFDFALPKGVFAFARDFAASIGGSYIVLDRKVKKNARVAKKFPEKILNYDFSLWRAKTISEDLARRDFTINSLAVNISQKEEKILGWEKAKEDLSKKRLRLAYKNAFVDDPLRILRAFSLAGACSLKIDREILAKAKKSRRRLKKVAPERISDELGKIFSLPSAYPLVKKMDEVFLWDEILPPVKKARGLNQGPYHHLDVWSHSLDTLKQLERLLRQDFFRRKPSASYLDTELSSRCSRRCLIKLACLLHDLGKPKAKKRVKGKLVFWEHEKIGRDLAVQIAERLKLSKREENFLADLVYFHLRPGYLTDNLSLSERPIYRFFRAAGENAPAVILLSLADLEATQGVLIEKRKRARQKKLFYALWEKYWERKDQPALPRLLNGFDIMKALKIKPSPLVGKILRQIEEEQSLGNIKTRSQALALAKEIAQEAFA